VSLSEVEQARAGAYPGLMTVILVEEALA